ncbi:hypothetical protein C8J57DRAFT_1493324 [Mycena rebaudengoi]|nr:hypothetical protein C8J57DRAFT_1493324 [Mycena rebaudengoi]
MMWAAALVLLVSTQHSFASLVDLTSANRRLRIPGLPDWTQVRYEKGSEPLPGDSSVAKTITAAQLASVYGVIPNDGVDDTDGLQKAISNNPGSPGAFTLIQLPAGTINLSFTIYISSNYLILRGAGNDPASGTVLSFSPDSNTQYDVLTQPGGDRWDLDGTIFSWSFEEAGDTKSGMKLVSGNATGGWLWPGRSIFRVGSKDIADKFVKPASMAPANRIDLFYGSVNYHWRNDSKIKGYMADQTMEIAGFAGTRKVYIDTQNSSWDADVGQDIWIGAPVRSYATGTGDDDLGHYIELDHDLEFDVYTSSITGGSPQMQGETLFTKIMPIDEPVHHVGIENLYMTQPMPSLSVADAVDNYGNMLPQAAMHGIVFRYARDSWVRNIRTFMTGSHPIATEAARYLQIQDNYFDGSWNKGAGGNGYVRGSRVWDSLYYNNTLRNLRHFTFQWCAMRNVATMQNMTNDMNMHGGYEGHNLLELNFVSVPYSHRAGSCLDHCGGEGGISDIDDGTWAPIYWSTGSKASKWSGATGPQNVFYRNYMLKAFTAGSDQVEYQPYFARDGSLSTFVWQFGWDRNTPLGSRYQHLSNDGSNLLFDWQGHEQDTFMTSPNVGVNGQLTDQYTSLFLRDVSNGTGITTFSAIAGFADCLGKVTPKVVGYYLGSAATRSCLPWSSQAIDPSIYTHVIYAYASLTAAGVVSLTSAQQAQVNSIIALKTVTPNLKVFIAVGGWGLGIDASPLIAIATSSSARTKFGTSALALLTSTGADGIDLEWSPCIGTTCISASQFSTIATALKTGLGSKLLSLSTPNAFWSLSGVNTITTNLAKIVEFVSLITHQPSTTSDDANEPNVIQATLKKAQSAGMPPTLLLFGVPFYSRPVGKSSLQSSCLVSGDLAQGTYPYYAVDAIINDGLYDSDAYTDLTRDETTSVQWLTMSDGSTMAAETPQSVSARALLSQNLCMGGLSVFSLDQDNTLSELTSMIYAPGGLLPTHDSIVASMSIESLDSSGYLQDGVYDAFASTLANEYAFLNVPDSFRILLLGALQIQSDLSNRLRLFLTESDLASDSFNLYKTWEGKAADYNLANLTGTGKSFWHCEGDGASISSCPGSIIEDVHLPAQSPHLTGHATVQWFLDDADGFKQYLNDSVGIDLDDLVEGEFYVTRLDESCTKGVPPVKPPVNPDIQDAQPLNSSVSRNLQDAHSSNRRKSRHHSHHHSHQTKKRDTDDASDPFDPPENCRTKWTGLRLVNPDTFFTDPVDIIRSYVQSTDNAVTQYTSLAAAPDTDTGSLIGLLTSTLTAISLGNQTIANTIAYIQEVEFDKVRQAAFDQAHARESVLNIILNIGLMILSVWATDIVSGGLDTFGLISKAMDTFSLAKTLDKDSDIFKLFGTGLRTEDEVAGAADAAEDVIGDEARETRGTLADSVGKVQDTAIQCVKSTLGPFTMDTSKLASVLRRRSFHSPPDFGTTILSHDQSISRSFLTHRAPAKDPCVFKLYTGGELKISSTKYRALCTENNLQMAIPDSLANPTSTTTGSFTDCVAIHEGDCQYATVKTCWLVYFCWFRGSSTLSKPTKSPRSMPISDDPLLQAASTDEQAKTERPTRKMCRLVLPVLYVLDDSEEEQLIRSSYARRIPDPTPLSPRATSSCNHPSSLLTTSNVPSDISPSFRILLLPTLRTALFTPILVPTTLFATLHLENLPSPSLPFPHLRANGPSPWSANSMLPQPLFSFVLVWGSRDGCRHQNRSLTVISISTRVPPHPHFPIVPPTQHSDSVTLPTVDNTQSRGVRGLGFPINTPPGASAFTLTFMSPINP